MTDRPIIFSGAMVRALLRECQAPGTGKTMTRRLIRMPEGQLPDLSAICRRYMAGDRLWVRESFSEHINDGGCWYWADGNIADQDSERPRPSIHMPRIHSRITLLVTEVKVERLQDISEADAIAEGAPLYVCGHGEITEDELRADPGYANFVNRRMGFAVLWDSLHGAGAWVANPWVVVIRFKPVLRNIDQLEAA